MIDFSGRTVMIISPHMDDEVIGCSGTITLFRKEINRLIIVHMTEDESRIVEYQEINKLLQVDNHYELCLEDGFIEENYKQAVLKLIEIIQEEKPQLIFIPHSDDNHVDHIATHRIAIDAIEKSRYWNDESRHHNVQDILEYEVWSFQKKVSYVVDISLVINQKIQLMEVYSSQLDFDYLRFIKYINGYRGLLHNKKGYAECFNLRSV